MRLFSILSVFCCCIAVSAQTPVIIDTLSKEGKENFVNEYKNSAINLKLDGSKKEFKQIKKIYDEIFDEFKKQIEKNKFVNYSPVNQYLNSLLDEIKSKNTDISNDVKLIISRQFSANAAHWGEGTIAVNQYLFKCIDNEDQLVSIICHEIAHHTLSHSLKNIINRIRKDASKEFKTDVFRIRQKSYGRQTEAENMLKQLAYENSKEHRYQETQADSLGCVYYAKLGRNALQPIVVMERLRDSDNEPDSLTIDDYRKIFADKSLNFNDKWFDMGDYGKYYYKEDTKFNADSLRTHPNMNERIEKLKNLFPQEFSDTTIIVKQSEEFKKWKENADYQNIYNLYACKYYGNCLYEALKCYNRQPTEFLVEYIGKSFEKLGEAKQKYQLNRYVAQINVNEFTKSYNLFCTFAHNLSVDELKNFSIYYLKK